MIHDFHVLKGIVIREIMNTKHLLCVSMENLLLLQKQIQTLPRPRNPLCMLVWIDIIQGGSIKSLLRFGGRFIRIGIRFENKIKHDSNSRLPLIVTLSRLDRVNFQFHTLQSPRILLGLEHLSITCFQY